MCAGSPSKSKSGDSDLSLNPQRRVSSKKEKKRGKKKPGRRLSFLPREKRKVDTFFFSNKEEKGRKSGYRSSSSDRRSQLTERDSGAFQPRCFSEKRRRNTEKGKKKKKQSPTKLIHPVLHPYLNSSVHFAQFCADLDNIPNMTRS